MIYCINEILVPRFLKIIAIILIIIDKHLTSHFYMPTNVEKDFKISLRSMKRFIKGLEVNVLFK